MMSCFQNQIFEFICKYDDVRTYDWTKLYMKSHKHFMGFQKMLKIWGYLGILTSYGGFYIDMFLPLFTLYCPLTRARILKFDARVWHYGRSRMTGNSWKLSKLVSEIKTMRKKAFLRCVRAARAHNARADAHGRKFLKCLK